MKREEIQIGLELSEAERIWCRMTIPTYMLLDIQKYNSDSEIPNSLQELKLNWEEDEKT